MADAGIVAAAPRSTRPSPERRASQAGTGVRLIRCLSGVDGAGAAGPPPGSSTGGDIPATTPVSDALSKDLRARGFRFVGSTIVYAFMQSVGLVDDHLPGCFRYGVVGVTR